MRSIEPRESEAEPSHLAGAGSLAPKMSVTACSSSAAGAGCGLVTCACVADWRQSTSPAAQRAQRVTAKGRVDMPAILSLCKAGEAAREHDHAASALVSVSFSSDLAMITMTAYSSARSP